MKEGSPLQYAAQFGVPVLMFSGDQDLNVDVSHARTMNAALKRAGKASELVEYKGLSHSLVDSRARADLLKQSDAFLRAKLKL